MVILSTDDWACVFLFVVWMRCPEQGATGGWVMLGLVFKWFFCVNSHYLIVLRAAIYGVAQSRTQLKRLSSSSSRVSSLVV